MNTSFIKDIPDYKRLTDEQCRELVRWGLENGLLRWPAPVTLPRDPTELRKIRSKIEK